MCATTLPSSGVGGRTSGRGREAPVEVYPSLPCPISPGFEDVVLLGFNVRGAGRSATSLRFMRERYPGSTMKVSMSSMSARRL